MVFSRYTGRLGYLEWVNMDIEKKNYFFKFSVMEGILKSLIYEFFWNKEFDKFGR